MNKVCLTGRLTRDPEFKTVGYDNISLCRFTIAVNRREKDKADFVPIVCWRSVAETCNKYLVKGDLVGVVGSLQSEEYEANGEKRRSWAVQAESVDFLRNKGESGGNGENSPEDRHKVTPEEVRASQTVDDDLPF